MTLKLGIIGGSGIYDLQDLEDKKVIKSENGPFGKPSADILYGNLHGVEIFFIPRHGKNHIFTPTNVPYRANIDILKRLGCNDLLSVSAVGSLKEDLYPGKFILVDQYIDRSYLRKKTFFDRGIVAHVSMAEPICKLTSELVFNAAISENIDIEKNGTYLVMEGPQFSTYAESKLYRSWDCDVIGMTNMPEAKLAREAEMRYVPIAMVTDYDCWKESEENVGVEDIVRTLNKNANKAKALIKSFVVEFKKYRPLYVEGIDNVLDTAIITSNYSKKNLIDSGLDAIASRVINAS
tara:strand:+ start:1848 stop:2726 length:879 start_codon:yes stop_codon:yes gene_type:complete